MILSLVKFLLLIKFGRLKFQILTRNISIVDQYMHNIIAFKDASKK